MILGERFGARGDLFFTTNWGAKEFQNLPNHRVATMFHFIRDYRGMIIGFCMVITL